MNVIKLYAIELVNYRYYSRLMCAGADAFRPL